MAAAKNPELIAIDGLQRSPRRNIVLLRMHVIEINLETNYDKLARLKKKTAFNTLRRSAEYWLAGHDSMPQRHHGWNQTEFKGELVQCHVFKSGTHRFCGYKFNPMPTEPGFQVCVLMHYYKKKKRTTPLTEVRQVVKIASRADVRRAVSTAYKREGKNG